jgi:hypothetical protein
MSRTLTQLTQRTSITRFIDTRHPKLAKPGQRPQPEQLPKGMDKLNTLNTQKRQSMPPPNP